MTASLASDVKDWISAAGIVVGGIWAYFTFSHKDWLRRRSEVPSLEGSNPDPVVTIISDGRFAVALRWCWKNAGSRPVYVEDASCKLEVFDVTGLSEATIIDPRQNRDKLLDRLAVSHSPLAGFGFYMLEPGVTSTFLTIPVLAEERTWLARLEMFARRDEHPTGGQWSYSWERWQIFSTTRNVSLEHRNP